MTDETSPIHMWFGLSYCSYFVIPRIALTSLPEDWQQRFVDLMDEAYEKHGMVTPDDYIVQRRSPSGRFEKDEWANYRRGDIEQLKKGLQS